MLCDTLSYMGIVILGLNTRPSDNGLRYVTQWLSWHEYCNCDTLCL